ncbi:MAG: hypothetical protein R6X32_06935 [Chloroflexota bacterium]
MTAASQIEVTGTCWRSWDRFTCTHSFAIHLTDDRLKITGVNEAEYQRIVEPVQERPSTLAPPFPSPTPNP